MSTLSPVTIWVSQLSEGDPLAAEELWNTYFLRMVKVARARLNGAPSRMADEEDVALSAFKSFCRGTRDGRFPQLLEQADPWPLLMALTTRKAIDLVRHEQRVKRGGSGSQSPRFGEAQCVQDIHDVLSELISREPDPQVGFQLLDECQHILDTLSDTVLRAIASWKMEGFTTEEIAGKLGCTTRTVERKLQIIRRQWNFDEALP